MLDPENILLLPLLLLLITMALGLLRALRGPELQDRMLSILLLGSNGIALLLVLSFVLEQPALVDIALVLSLLAVMAAAALTRSEARDD
jgi:multicomponent Na+:H+ antiporter subunit F